MAVIDTNSIVSGKIQTLKDRGVTAVGRYYTSLNSSKKLEKPEAQKISAANIKIFVVYEDHGDPELTEDKGRADATAALQQAQAIGQPEGSAIYFALEHLPNGYTHNHIPGIKLYVNGLKAVIGNKYKLGVYSDGVVCDALLSSGQCDFAWLSASMGFEGSKKFFESGRWVLAQKTPLDQDWNGLSIDINDAKPEFGAFSLPPAVA